MKKLMIGLPLALLLAYCSGPNNTQTMTDTDMDATSATASTTTTTTEDMATTTTDMNDETVTLTTDETATVHSDVAMGNVVIDHSNSVISPLPSDTMDPMYQHWERTNARHWTWDYDYPGYDRPMAGTYNSAINGNWQVVMTPELATAWRTDDSRSLWLRDGQTYLSASESFDTRNEVNGTASVNVDVNANAGTLDGSTTANSTASGSVINNSANSAATMDGAYSSTFDPQSNQNPRTGGVTGSTEGNVSLDDTSASDQGLNNTSANATKGNQVNNDTKGTTGVNGSVSVSGTTGTEGTTEVLDVNSINYNAYNGNMYQLPKFNLYLDNGSFTGYTGCNGISGRVEVTGTGLRFLNTSPSTAIDCMGGFDEGRLLDMLNRVDSYAYVGDELQLMQGNQVLLRLKRNDQDTSLQ